jgi:hypothetical protein
MNWMSAFGWARSAVERLLLALSGVLPRLDFSRCETRQLQARFVSQLVEVVVPLGNSQHLTHPYDGGEKTRSAMRS